MSPDVYPIAPRESATLPYFYARFGATGSVSQANLVFGAVLRGELDAMALRKALQRVVQASPALRCRYSGDGTQPTKYLVHGGDLPFTYRDCQGGGQAFKSAVREAAEHAFDLRAYPLFHLYLLRRSARRHLLVLVAHHLLMDGWSVVVFLRALSKAYRHVHQQGDEEAQAPADVSAQLLAQHIAAQQAYLASAQGQARSREMLEWLQPVAHSLLPSAPLRFPMEREAHRLIRLEADKARDICRIHQLSATQFHRALYALLQHVLTGQADFAFSEAHANRPKALRGAYGFLSDDWLMRVRIDPDMTMADFVQQIQDAHARAMRFAGVPSATALVALTGAAALPRFHFNPLEVGLNVLRLQAIATYPFNLMRSLALTEMTWVAGDATRMLLATAWPQMEGRDLPAIEACIHQLTACLHQPALRIRDVA